ncbi:hypothetical protein K474DRAFT_1680804, partial [Panus rudis PR-1116 ss-1]
MSLQYQYRKTWQKSGLACNFVRCVSFSRDGSQLAVGGAQRLTVLAVDSDIWIIDNCAQEDGQVEVAHARALSHTIRHASLNRAGDYLVTGEGADGRVWKKREEGWREACRLPPPTTYRENHLFPVEIVSLQWYNCVQQRRLVLVTYKQHGIQIWDVTDGPNAVAFSTILDTSRTIGRSSLSLDGQTIAVTMQTRFDVHAIESRLPTFSLDHDGNIENPIIFVHGDTAILAPFRKGQLRMWKAIDGTRMQTIHHS